MDPKDRVETLIKTKASSLHKRISGNDSPAGAGYQVEPADVEAILADWPAAPKKVAQGLLDRYGPPNEATPSHLIWHNNGAWKRTVVTRDEALHNFPTPHTDYITQTIAREGLETFGANDFAGGVFDNLSLIRDHEAAHVVLLTDTVAQLGESR